MLTEFLVGLTWTVEKHLRDEKITNLVSKDMVLNVLSGFGQYDFLFMRYNDIVVAGYEKAKDMTMYEEKDDKTQGKPGMVPRVGGGGIRNMKF